MSPSGIDHLRPPYTLYCGAARRGSSGGVRSRALGLAPRPCSRTWRRSGYVLSLCGGDRDLSTAWRTCAAEIWAMRRSGSAVSGRAWMAAAVSLL